MLGLPGVWGYSCEYFNDSNSKDYFIFKKLCNIIAIGHINLTISFSSFNTHNSRVGECIISWKATLTS